MNIMQALKERLRKFNQLEWQIEFLIQVLYFLLILIFAFIAFSVMTRKYDQLIDLFTPIIPMLAAILFAKASNRIIIDNDINKIDEKRCEILQITHYQIAIAKDLRQKIHFFKKIIEEKNIETPIVLLIEIANTIESRYEELLSEKESYRHLSGKCIDILISMSGAIFGIKTLGEGYKKIVAINQANNFKSHLSKDDENLTNTMNKVLDELEIYIDELFKLRNSIEDNAEKSSKKAAIEK